jgi:ubiquinone/menaquinone biosynthesis C-methylase UbiE
MEDGVLLCRGCEEPYPVRRGTPRLVVEDRIGGADSFMRAVYSLGGPLVHDFAVRVILAAADGDFEETRWRSHVARRLGLSDLETREGGGPLRVLETGAGSGANLPYLLREARAPFELWASDINDEMLEGARRRIREDRLASPDGSPVRLLTADAHHLPFADGSFDRVLHVGGIGAFSDPARAVREMVRVARPGARILFVDEALDPSRTYTPFQLWYFWTLSPHAPFATTPRHLVPPGMRMVADEMLGRFYYLLAFDVPETTSSQST